MNKKAKTTLQFFIAGALFASVAVIGCNNSSENKEAPKADSVTTEKPMEQAPPAADTTKKMDSASTRPTIPGS